jgi:hypothetical protein
MEKEVKQKKQGSRPVDRSPPNWPINQPTESPATYLFAISPTGGTHPLEETVIVFLFPLQARSTARRRRAPRRQLPPFAPYKASSAAVRNPRRPPSPPNFSVSLNLSQSFQIAASQVSG